MQTRVLKLSLARDTLAIIQKPWSDRRSNEGPCMALFCSLLRNGFLWTAERDHDQTATKAKGCLTIAPVLAFFDMVKLKWLCTERFGIWVAAVGSKW